VKKRRARKVAKCAKIVVRGQQQWRTQLKTPIAKITLTKILLAKNPLVKITLFRIPLVKISLAITQYVKKKYQHSKEKLN